MTTATGQRAIDFSGLGNANPYTNSNLTVRSGGTTRVASALWRPNTTAFVSWTGDTYSGSAISVAVEASASAVDDEPVLYITSSAGTGYALMIQPTTLVILELTAWVVTDSAGTAASTLTANDLFTFQLTKGSPNTYVVTKNGVGVTLSQSSATHSAGALGTLEAGWQLKAENVGTCAIKSIAVVSGLNGGATSTPTTGSLSLVGQAPSVANSGIANVTRTPTAGSLSFTGQQPTQTLSVAAPVVGALSLGGVAATLVQGAVRATVVGAIAITGIAPSLLTAFNRAPSAGSAAFSGSAPTVSNSGQSSFTITPTVGVITMTGNVVTAVPSSRTITPGTGTLVFSGSPPSVGLVGSGMSGPIAAIVMRRIFY